MLRGKTTSGLECFAAGYSIGDPMRKGLRR